MLVPEFDFSFLFSPGLRSQPHSGWARLLPGDPLEKPFSAVAARFLASG